MGRLIDNVRGNRAKELLEHISALFTKEEVIAMLTEIQLEIEELEPLASDSVGFDICVSMSSDIIQQKINALKAETEDQDGQTSN